MLVLTRDPVAERIGSVVVAALTRTRRGLISELDLTVADDRVPTDCVVNFDNLTPCPGTRSAAKSPRSLRPAWPRHATCSRRRPPAELTSATPNVRSGGGSRGEPAHFHDQTSTVFRAVRPEGLEPPTPRIRSLRSSDVIGKVRRRIGPLAWENTCSSFASVAGRFACFHGPRRPGEGLDGTRDSLAYASWVMVSTLPSLSLNQTALPAGVVAIPFTV